MKNGLVKMIQNGENILVNPVAVADHQKIGWELVEPNDQVEIAEYLARTDPAVVKASADVDKALVKMFKPGKAIEVNPSTTIYADGEVIEVNPTTVEAHIKVGWTILDENYQKAAGEAFLRDNPLCSDPYRTHGEAKVKSTSVFFDESSGLPKEPLCHTCAKRMNI